jgi:hypothetical protein
MKPDFTWTSPLGISAISFITMAVVYILIGTLGIIILAKNGAGNLGGQYYFGGKADEIIFGKPVKQVNEETPHIGKYITMLMIVFCSFMVSMGILQYGIARYALTDGKEWAYWVSGLSNAFMLVIYWFMIIIPVLKETHVGYFSTWHPYAFVPTILFPVAVIMGWIGLRS